MIELPLESVVTITELPVYVAFVSVGCEGGLPVQEDILTVIVIPDWATSLLLASTSCTVIVEVPLFLDITFGCAVTRIPKAGVKVTLQLP